MSPDMAESANTALSDGMKDADLSSGGFPYWIQDRTSVLPPHTQTLDCTQDACKPVTREAWLGDALEVTTRFRIVAQRGRQLCIGRCRDAAILVSLSLAGSAVKPQILFTIVKIAAVAKLLNSCVQKTFDRDRIVAIDDGRGSRPSNLGFNLIFDQLTRSIVCVTDIFFALNVRIFHLCIFEGHCFYAIL